MAKPPRAAAIVPAIEAFEPASAALAAGGLVALPTETVYGLAARADSEAAVRAIYAAKGRPAHNPLIVHVFDAEQAFALLTPTAQALGLAAAFWPGPLTLVGTCREGAPVAPAARAGGTTIAVRVPSALLVQRLAAAVGPLVAPSANRSGRVTATTAAAVAQELGTRVNLIVDGGPSPIGVESTVVDITGGPRVLRPGAIEAAALEAVAGPLASDTQRGPLRSPGLLPSHYAPAARVRLDVAPQDVRPGEAYLSFGPEPAAGIESAQLSKSADLVEAARNLYEGLRQLDRPEVSTIAVAPIPPHGLGAAIRDRLERAAHPRPADTVCG